MMRSMKWKELAYRGNDSKDGEDGFFSNLLGKKS